MRAHRCFCLGKKNFLRQLIWPLCIFFASQHFSNLRYSFMKRLFGFFPNVIKKNFKQKILLTTPYMQKVWDPTSLKPKFDVKRPSL